MDIISLRQSDLGQHAKELARLQKKRRDKLKEQGELSQQLNKLVTLSADDSKKVLKSLEAAVATSTRPGDQHYYTGKKELSNQLTEYEKLIQAIQRTEQEINGIEQEIQSLNDKKKAQYAQVTPVSSISDWFARNGKPKKLDKPEYGYVTQFKPSKDRVPHWGIDDKTGTFSSSMLKQTAPRSAVVSMHRGRIASSPLPGSPKR